MKPRKKRRRRRSMKLLRTVMLRSLIYNSMLNPVKALSRGLFLRRKQ